MKLVCKNNNKNAIDDEFDYELSLYSSYSGDHLIIDKVYEVLGTDIMDFNNPSEVYYLILNEFDQQFWYSSNRFKTVSENREEKLNELGL
jgi:hypothetical protein